MLNWTRRTVGVDFLGTTRRTTEHVTTYAGREFALRKVDDLFFVYLNGESMIGRPYFHTLREGKAAVERAVNGGAR